jgi:hypothetical protein
MPQIKQRMGMQILEPERNWNEYNEKLPLVKDYAFTTFENLLKYMQPMYYPEKALIFQAKNGWVGFMENLITGTEIRRITQIATRIDINKESIGVQAWYGGGRKIANGWSGGSFSLFGGKDNYGQKRHIMLSDQDKWEFDQSGEPLSFEDVEKYKEKLVRNRFTPEMLQQYLLHYGIDFFNDDFYMPEGSKAYIIEYVRDKYDNEESKTLLQRRIELKYESPI